MKIMIIDNNEMSSEFIKAYMNDNDVSIVTVTSPFEALDLMKKEKFDIIIMEMIMDKMNSIELFDRLKKIDSNTKLIVLSKFWDYGFEKLASIKGFYGYYTRSSFTSIKKDILQLKNTISINSF